MHEEIKAHSLGQDDLKKNNWILVLSSYSKNNKKWQQLINIMKKMMTAYKYINIMKKNDNSLLISWTKKFFF